MLAEASVALTPQNPAAVMVCAGGWPALLVLLVPLVQLAWETEASEPFSLRTSCRTGARRATSAGFHG